MVVELADFYKSLKRRETAEKEKGIRPVQVGKEALPFNIYRCSLNILSSLGMSLLGHTSLYLGI